VKEMGKAVLPHFPVWMLATQHFDNLARVSALKMPLLVMHSPQDDIVPFRMGQELYETAPQPKVFAELRGDHNEGFMVSGELYPRSIHAFLLSQGIVSR
jgi:fermentation-respiration switch protein FrsA (DUF1100 family)